MRIFILKNTNIDELITDLEALLMRYCTYNWITKAFNYKDIKKTQKDENDLFTATLKLDGELIELNTNTYKYNNRIDVMYMGKNGTYYNRKKQYEKYKKTQKYNNKNDIMFMDKIEVIMTDDKKKQNELKK